MELVQARLVTEDVAGLAAFYTELVGAKVPLNEYYVEVPAGPVSVGLSRRRFTEYREGAASPGRAQPPREVILDFVVRDVDAEFPRVAALGAGWVLPPTTQPWGSRSMIFSDPEGNLVNVFSRPLPAGPPAGTCPDQAQGSGIVA
jgi:predicted enzyme related to lactoylglutathione lyase